MSNTAPLTRSIELTGDAFVRVFPFYFAWNEALRIVNLGPSLAKICADAVRGVAVDEVFEILRPASDFSAEQLKTHVNDLFLLRHRGTSTRFRGQVLELPNVGATVMLCSPCLQSADVIESLGITFNDFALHDSSLDLLQLLRTQQMANSDLKTLARRLTEQRAKLRVQEAEARKLSLVAARTDNAVLFTDAKGCIEWVNDGFVRETGYTLDEMRGRTPGSVLQGPETDPKTVEYMRTHIRAGKGFRAELLNYHKNGSRFLISLEVQPILNEAGEVTNFMAIQRDVTQQRRDEQRRELQFNVSRILNEADTVREATARIIQEVCQRLGWITGIIWMLQETHDHLELVDLWHNPSIDISRFAGESRSMTFQRGVDLPGRAWATRQSQWIPDVTVDGNLPRAEAAASSDLHGALSFPILSKGTVLGVFEFYSKRIEHPDEELLRTMNGVGNQVGQFVVRKQTEAALQDSSTLQRAILGAANYSIISTDPDGTIRTFNHTAECMLGYQADDLVGKATPGIIHVPAEVQARAAELSAELGKTVEAGFEAFVAKVGLGEPDEREWTYVRKDGTRFPVLLSVTALFNAQGAITGYLGVASDITERKRAAADLLNSKEQAESANRAKSDFLATMSHEIRTPMNAIIGMSSLLLDTKIDTAQHEMVEAVRNSGEALMVIIDDILDFSKIEARRLDLVDEVFSLDSVIDGVVDLLAHKAQAKGLEVRVMIEPDVPMSLAGDPGRLRQVLLNLVGNATKFTDEGEVNISVSRERRTGDEASFIKFVVEDSGIGMMPEQQAQLFQPFTQVDGTSTRRYGGTGLGLVISKRLIELMGGSIEVESERHRGSKFSFCLPLRMVLTPEVASAWPDLVRKYRVLVADPAPLSRRAIKAALDGLMHAPTMVETESSAVSALLDPKLFWDVLVMDRRLFGDKTIDVVEQLQQQKRKPRIIVLGQITESVRERGAPTGVDVFLDKPMRRQQLRTAFRQLAMPETGAKPVAASKHTHSGVQPRLLIVEDNEVNSRLATLLLEKLGCTSEVASDGVEALARFETGVYEGVLMDCHMPRMDGYDATRKIREIEASVAWNRPRVRIIAMTANAMAGERERCLAAGMDDYLSKPLRTAALMEALAKIEISDAGYESEPDIEWSVSDESEALQSIRQLAEELSPESALELLGNWLEDAPIRLEEIMQLAGGTDQITLKRFAHSLKGSSALFGLTSIHALCRDLEQLAERGTHQGQKPLATKLKEAFKVAELSLRAEMERLR